MAEPGAKAPDIPPAHDRRTTTPSTRKDGLGGMDGATVGSSAKGHDGQSRPDRDLVVQIERLPIDDLQKTYLHGRWLDQVAWLGRGARRDQRRYYALRLVTILGGVTIPALVGVNVDGEAASTVRWATFGLGLLVAAAAALEEFFRYGERWRHYRQQAELLKAEGWAFLQLAGPAYRRYDSHAEAFRTFVGRVEDAVRQEVGVYVAEVARAPERPERDDREGVERKPTP